MSYGKMRDVSYMKPSKFRNYLTLTELAVEVGKDTSWIRKLEAAGRIPIPRRVQRGEILVRLYSPAQVEEIRDILSRMQRGRPASA